MRSGRNLTASQAYRASLVLLPIGIALVLTGFLYRPDAQVEIDFERGYEDGFISGFHPRERAGRQLFRWSTGESYIEVDHLPSRGQLEVEVRLNVLRPSAHERPLVWFSVNGATLYQARAEHRLATYRFTLPLRSSSLRLGIHSETFQAPGSRRLGVQVLSVRLSATEGKPALGPPLVMMALAAALFLGSFKLAGLSLLAASITATAFTGAFTYLLAQGSLRFSQYPEQVLVLASIGLVVSALLFAALHRVDWPLSRERPALIAVLSGGLVLKLGCLFYPFMLGSDWIFHSNRLAELLHGNFYLTSVSQHEPPFHIPYPVSLYVVAAPWALAGVDRLAVLKVITVACDVSIGFVLFFLARRYLNNARAGLLAAVLYQLVPINLLAFSSGNFSNLFGVSTTVFFYGLLLWGARRGSSLSAVGALIFSVLALTSHFSTFLFDIVLWPFLIVALFAQTPAGLRRHTRVLGLAVLLSLGVVAAYYSGYWELFTSQWQRVLGRDYATGDSMVAGPIAKLQFNLAFYREQIGTIFALLAALGAIPILRRAPASAFHASSVAWSVAAGLFFLLDLTTALEVRYTLQAAPLFSLFAAAYLAGALERGKLGKTAALIALVYLTGVGLLNAHHCLLYRYH